MPQSKYRSLLYVYNSGCGKVIKLNVWGLLIQFLFQSIHVINMQRFSGMQWDAFWNVKLTVSSSPYSSFQMQWHLPLFSSRRNVLPKMAICITYHSVYMISELPRHLEAAKGVFIHCIAFWHMFWVVISMYIQSSIIEWPKWAQFRYYVDNTFTSFRTWSSEPPPAQQHEMWHEYVLIWVIKSFKTGRNHWQVHFGM